MGPYSPWLEHKDSAVRANATICLIHQATFLLNQQIAALEKAFIEDAGYREQLAAKRLDKRPQRAIDPTDPSDPSDQIPPYPQCGAFTVLRTAKTGGNAGSQFWGCTAYPNRKGIVDI